MQRASLRFTAMPLCALVYVLLVMMCSCRNLGRGSRTQIAAKQTQDKVYKLANTAYTKCSHCNWKAGPSVRHCMQSDAESTTENWGLEAGLFKVFTNKDDKGNKTKGQQAKELLTRYGSAYLITSISFAIVSFTLCYALISSGINMTYSQAVHA